MQGAQVTGPRILPVAYEVEILSPQDLVDIGTALVVQGKNDVAQAAPHERFCTGSPSYVGPSSREPPVLGVEESPRNWRKTTHLICRDHDWLGR